MTHLMSKQFKLLASFAVALTIQIQFANADIVDVFGTPSTVHGDPANSGGGTVGGAAQVGTGGAGGPGDNIGLAGILFFELPDLTDTQTILLSELTVMLTGARDDGPDRVPDDYNVDLYVLPARAAETLDKPGDYGDAGGVPATATLIMEDWWAQGDDSQIGTSKTIDVTSAIQSLYTAGVPDSTYAVFALYADDDLPDSYNGTYFFEQSTENPSGPQLSITAVPEPGSIGLTVLLLAAVANIRQRRRRIAA